MKRYRDENGLLTTTIDQIRKETADEAAKYYRIGSIYLHEEDGREYVYISDDEGLAHFHSFDDHHFFVAIIALGTLLPDVASDGMALIFVE